MRLLRNTNKAIPNGAFLKQGKGTILHLDM